MAGSGIFLKSPSFSPPAPGDYRVQQEQTFSLKDQILNTVGFVCYTFSVATT